MSVIGVEGEERNDFSKAESRQIRRRSLHLLGSLLRPLRAQVAARHRSSSSSRRPSRWPGRR